MERNEVSLQEVRFFKELLQNTGRWLTSKELATASGIAERTSRAYAMKFAKLGILDAAEVFPAHRYRLSEKADKRNFSYINRLRGAAEIFGVQLQTKELA